MFYLAYLKENFQGATRASSCRLLHVILTYNIEFFSYCRRYDDISTFKSFFLNKIYSHTIRKKALHCISDRISLVKDKSRIL